MVHAVIVAGIPPPPSTNPLDSAHCTDSMSGVRAELCLRHSEEERHSDVYSCRVTSRQRISDDGDLEQGQRKMD